MQAIAAIPGHLPLGGTLDPCIGQPAQCTTWGSLPPSVSRRSNGTGPDVLQLVYQGQKPEARFFDQMPLLQAHYIPVRSTSKLLGGAKYKTTGEQPGGNATGPPSVPAAAALHLQPKAFASNLHQWNAESKQQVASHCGEPSNSHPLPLQGEEHAAPVAAPSQAIVPVPPPQLEDAKETDDQEVPKNKDGKATKTLDQWNQHAFASMLKKQEMKKPAAAKVAKPAKAKVATKGKKPQAKAKKPQAKAKTTIKKAQSFGCLGCRGNLNGCATCRKPGFQGLKVHGREAWYRLAPNAK